MAVYTCYLCYSNRHNRSTACIHTATSITDILDKLPVWYNNVTIFITDFEKNHKDLGFIDYNIINEHLTSLYPKILSYLTDILTNILPYVVNTSMAIIKGLINLIISVMVSVYMISDHKNIFYQFKRLLYAVFPKQAADTARQYVVKVQTFSLNSCMEKLSIH
jgi:predicted PurR-regulated permease PerM